MVNFGLLAGLNYNVHLVSTVPHDAAAWVNWFMSFGAFLAPFILIGLGVAYHTTNINQSALLQKRKFLATPSIFYAGAFISFFAIAIVPGGLTSFVFATMGPLIFVLIAFMVQNVLAPKSRRRRQTRTVTQEFS